jgi:hypothetical protein
VELRHDPVVDPVNDNASKVPTTEAQYQTNILNENPSDNHEQEQHSPTTHLETLTFSRPVPWNATGQFFPVIPFSLELIRKAAWLRMAGDAEFAAKPHARRAPMRHRMAGPY